MWLILQVPENATTRDVIKQAVAKAGSTAGSEHEYVLLEEVWGVKNCSSNKCSERLRESRAFQLGGALRLESSTISKNDITHAWVSFEGCCAIGGERRL